MPLGVWRARENQTNFFLSADVMRDDSICTRRLLELERTSIEQNFISIFIV